MVLILLSLSGLEDIQVRMSTKLLNKFGNKKKKISAKDLDFKVISKYIVLRITAGDGIARDWWRANIRDLGQDRNACIFCIFNLKYADLKATRFGSLLNNTQSSKMHMHSFYSTLLLSYYFFPLM